MCIRDRHLTLLDPGTGIHVAAHQLAAHAERQRAFLAGPHFTRIRGKRGLRTTAGVHHQYRARHFRDFGLVAATCQPGKHYDK